MLRKFLFSALAVLSLQATGARADNDRVERIVSDVCHPSTHLCVIFRVSLKIHVDASSTSSNSTPTERTRIAVNEHVYFDDNGESVKYTTRVIRNDNECSKDYEATEPVYRMIAQQLDALSNPDGALHPQLTKAQQAAMGMFLSLIDDKAQFDCAATEFSDAR